MYKNNTFLGIIPARGGSKRIPRKNIAELGGKPLITWTIVAGKKSRYLDELLVSTDDRSIMQIARNCKVSVPFLRPKSISRDRSSSYSVVQHAINYYINKVHKHYDYVVLLQPTSPLRTSEDIDAAIEMLFKKNADGIISVCRVDCSSLLINTLPEDLSFAGFIKTERLKKPNKSEYRINGAIYINKVERLLKERTFYFRSHIYAYIMPKERSIDIDTPYDLKCARLLIKQSD